MSGFDRVYANNYLISKGVAITYNKGGIPYSFCIDYQNLFTPTLKYMLDTGFRLYLRDFHGSTEVNDTYSLEKSLTNVHFTVHDLKSNIDIIDTMDLLSYSDVAQDEEGQYYIDIKFEDLLSMLRVGDGDYLFTFSSNLRSDKYVYAFNDENCTMTTNYQSVDYFRFKWFADSNSGLLVPCYEDGTEKPRRRWRRG